MSERDVGKGSREQEDRLLTSNAAARVHAPDSSTSFSTALDINDSTAPQPSWRSDPTIRKLIPVLSILKSHRELAEHWTGKEIGHLDH
jgi:hypothetical protein